MAGGDWQSDANEDFLAMKSAELRISEEIRELRRREEELRRLREANAQNARPTPTPPPTATATPGATSGDADAENLASIPTTDEGHFSDAEAHSDGRDASSDAGSRSALLH